MFLQAKVPARIGQFTGKSKEAEKQEFKGLGRGTGSWHWQRHSGSVPTDCGPTGVAGIVLLDFPCSQWKLET